MISVVCVYNSEDQFRECLLPTLENQNVKYELLGIDNRSNTYKCAAEALNAGGRRARGEYIMFAHQDVMLGSSDWLQSVERLLGGLSNLGIAGVAGKSPKDPWVLSNIEHGTPPRPAGQSRISVPTVVQTLDECVAIVPRSVFMQYPFAEDLCPDWHLYVVEYCLRLKRRKLNVYVLPVSLYHKSMGYPESESYFSSLENLLREYRGSYGNVYTTCGDWSTRFPLRLQRTGLWMFFKRALDFSRSALRKG